MLRRSSEQPLCAGAGKCVAISMAQYFAVWIKVNCSRRPHDSTRFCGMTIGGREPVELLARSQDGGARPAGRCRQAFRTRVHLRRGHRRRLDLPIARGRRNVTASQATVPPICRPALSFLRSWSGSRLVRPPHNYHRIPMGGRWRSGVTPALPWRLLRRPIATLRTHDRENDCRASSESVVAWPSLQPKSFPSGHRTTEPGAGCRVCHFASHRVRV